MFHKVKLQEGHAISLNVVRVADNQIDYKHLLHKARFQSNRMAGTFGLRGRAPVFLLRAISVLYTLEFRIVNSVAFHKLLTHLTLSSLMICSPQMSPYNLRYSHSDFAYLSILVYI